MTLFELIIYIVLVICVLINQLSIYLIQHDNNKRISDLEVKMANQQNYLGDISDRMIDYTKLEMEHYDNIMKRFDEIDAPPTKTTRRVYNT